MAASVSDKILLGSGVFSVGGTIIGLTRGGAFKVEREFYEIEADGDYGPVKGRTIITKEVASLSVKALEILPANLTKFFPAMSVTATPTETPTDDVWTSTLEILETDYQPVTWTGKTKDGKGCVIELIDAINMGNVEFALEDKKEVIPELEYTATYDETKRTTSPWSVKWAK